MVHPQRRFARRRTRFLPAPSGRSNVVRFVSPVLPTSLEVYYTLLGPWVYWSARARHPFDSPLGGRIAIDFLLSLDLDERRNILMGLAKPRVAVNGRLPGQGKPEDQEFEHEWPTLFAYLTDDVWEDGSGRERSTLLLFAEDVFKCCLIDKDNDCTLWASGRTLEDLLSGLETRLVDPEADWRKRKPPQPRKRS